MTAPLMSARLVTEDEELLALLRQTEDVLLALARSEEYSSEHDPEPWDLPAPLAGQAALDALYRVWDDLAAVLDTLHQRQPGPPRLLGPDGKYEHAPLRLADLEQADLETLAAALGAFNHALASATADNDPAHSRRQLRDLAELLDALTVDTSLWPPHSEPTTPADLLRPLARLVALLDMPPDADTAVLLGVLRDRAAVGDVVLTPAEEAAYQRVATRLNLVISDADPLHRYLY